MVELRSKRLSLIGLGILMAAVGILALGVAGRSLFERYTGQHRDVPTVLILSKDFVERGIEANRASDNDKINTQKWTADIIKASGEKPKDDKNGSLENGKNSSGNTSQPNDEYHADRNAQLQLLLASMEDGVGIVTSDALRHSKLFNPVAGGLVAGQLAQLHAARNDSGGSSAQTAGVAQKQSDSARQQAAVDKIKQNDPSLKVVANNVGAQYILTIEIIEPNKTAKILTTDKANSKIHFELTARPVVHVEIFPVDSKGFSDSKELVLPNAIRREVALSDPLISMNIESDIANAARDIDLEIHKKVGAAVAEWLINEVAPAHVVEAEGAQFTIDRGSNDGVRQGAIYTVMREFGNAITGSGIDGGARDLGKKRTQVGQVTIASVDPLKSTATTLSGGPFQKGDIVVMDGAGPIANAAPAPLGSRELAQSGVAGGSRVKLAVDDVVFSSAGQSGESSQLAQLIADALARDPRVTVLPRAQMRQVLDERSLNAQASGDEDGGGIQGMSTSNYLVSGSFSSQSSRHVKSRSISVGGVSETVSTTASVSTAVSGTLRVTSTTGELKFSTTVGGSSPQAVAEAAARALLVQLFPMQVIQVNGVVVVLDRGQDAGLKVGTRLSLFHVNKPIVDTATGATHEGLRIPAGEVTIQTVQPTISTAVLQAGAAAQTGDIAVAGADGIASGGGRGHASGASPDVRAPAHSATHRAAGKKTSGAASTDDQIHF